MTVTSTQAAVPATAQAVTDLLRRHYLPEGRTVAGIFAPEIGSPDGSRRADLIWAPTTIAGGAGLVGHEIKVSRADVQAELGDPAKADSWAKYCARWWLVVSDPRLISGLDVPTAWGVMAPPSGRRTRSMTILRPAPKLTPVNATPAWRRIAAWQLYSGQARLDAVRLENKQLQQRLDVHRRREAQAGLDARYRDDPRSTRLQNILQKLETAAHQAHLWHDLPDDAIVSALLDLNATSEAIRDTRYQVTRLLQQVETLTNQAPLTQLKERLSTVHSSIDALEERMNTTTGPVGGRVSTDA
jgi:hypothetical protein